MDVTLFDKYNLTCLTFIVIFVCNHLMVKIQNITDGASRLNSHKLRCKIASFFVNEECRTVPLFPFCIRMDGDFYISFNRPPDL